MNPKMEAESGDMLELADIDLIMSIFVPSNERPDFEIPRFWSNPRLQEPDTIIALVLERPTTNDLARVVHAYGPNRVLDVLGRMEIMGDLTGHQVTQARRWTNIVLKGVADAARELASA